MQRIVRLTFLMLFFSLLLGSSGAVLAQDKGPATGLGSEAPRTVDVFFRPQVDIPGIPGFAGQHKVDENLMADYFRAFYVYFISVVGVLAILMIVYGGFRWITAAGNPSKIQAAKDTITSALIGLVLALTSNLILRTINPNLIKLRVPGLQEIQTRLQRQYWCSMSGKAASDEMKAKGKTCGQDVPYTDLDSKEKHCIADACSKTGLREPGEQSRDTSAEICGWHKKKNQFECTSVENFCENDDFTDKNGCEDADLLISRLQPPVTTADPPTGQRYVCMKQITEDWFDRCRLVEGYQSVSGGYCPGEANRVDCDYSGKITPCHRDPSVKRNENIKCSNTDRPAKHLDAICCAYESEAKCSSENIAWKDEGFFPSLEGWVQVDPKKCKDQNKECAVGENCYIKVQLLR